MRAARAERLESPRGIWLALREWALRRPARVAKTRAARAAAADYMKKAADANDLFGMMYLANFYRYGMGTKPDSSLASTLVGKALKNPDRSEVYAIVQGIGKFNLLGALSAANDEEGCRESNRAHPMEPQRIVIKKPTFRKRIRSRAR